MSDYEFWLTDDAGRRLLLLKDLAFASYTRTVNGLGTLSVGVPFDILSNLKPYFQPDWRVEVWRSPSYGSALRREDVFLLRKPNIYIRTEDNIKIAQFYGRNGIDLLNRRSVIQRAGTSYAKKTDLLDDMMKAYVREQMLYGSALDEDGAVDNTRAWPEDEFTVQTDAGAGPSVTRDFADRKVFDLLKDLKNTSFQLNKDDPDTYQRIFFDVVPVSLSGGKAPTGWEFRTYAGIRGADRTQGITFSLENENIKQPAYSRSHLDEVSSVIVRGNGSGLSQIVTVVDDAARVGSSRWNRVEKVISASSETSTTALQDAARAELYKGKPKEEIPVTFLNTPGERGAPRSLYGIDWDLGDLLRVDYADQQFNAEVMVVYVSLSEDGKETITGRNEVQS